MALPEPKIKLIQGLIIAIIVIVLSITGASLLALHYKVNQNLVLSALSPKMLTAAVAGQPVQWTVLVKRSQKNA